MGELRDLIDKLYREHELTHDEYVQLFLRKNEEDSEYMRELAQQTAIANYGHDVYLRGLIEFTNYCRNDCLYCGIRRSNDKVDRYRLSKDEILECCDIGYKLDLRTFVLQGGEDMSYSDDLLCEIISSIKSRYPDCALTLSVGERPRESYERYYEAGADRFLLRHETATSEHYAKLHPAGMTLATRLKCLEDLKDIGYQVGAGFMVGAPYQTVDNIATDLEYLKELEPHMIGIGPFIHHKDTPFCDFPDGTQDDTLYCLSILRLMFPKALIPATTALGTIDPHGRERGILHGANVIMPSLSPQDIRGKYLLYDGKVGTDEEATKSRQALDKRMEDIGYRTVSARGDQLDWTRKD